MIRDDWTDCEHWYEHTHVERVWTAIERNFSTYFSSFTQTGSGDHLREKARMAILDYTLEAGKYRRFLDPDAIDDYRADPRQFSRDIIRDLPLIRRLIRDKRKDLREWKLRFNAVCAKHPTELLRVFDNQARFATAMNKRVDLDTYGKVDDRETLDFDKFDQGAEDERFVHSAGYTRNADGQIKFGKYHIAGSIGLGIITTVLWYHAPGHLPRRGRQSLVALHFLSGKDNFGLPSRTSEFLMYTPFDGTSRIEHNFYYPYSLFTLYSLRIARLMANQFAALSVPFNPAYRFVLTEVFFQHVAEQHAAETRDWIEQDGY